MVPISQKYRNIAQKMVDTSSQSSEITGNNVYQEGNDSNRALVDKIVADLLLPGSRIRGFENLESLAKLADSGRSCLVLMEHYSNFDIPCLYYLLEQSEPGRGIGPRIVSMAGMKLNTDSPFVLAFTEAYTRIVIYPSRSLASITDPHELARERRRSNEINRASLHEMVRQKHSGKLILVFPAGTRYRPGREDTKRGLKEIDSYIKSFDYMVLVGIAGSVLRISSSESMSDDLVTEDVVVYAVSPPMSCKEYRDRARATESAHGETVIKQHVADTVMADLEHFHGQAEEIRAPLIDKRATG